MTLNQAGCEVKITEHAAKEFKNMSIQKPDPISRKSLLLAHDENYVDAFLQGRLNEKEKRRIGLTPWSPKMIERTLCLTDGAVKATIHAIKNGGITGNMAGGTHHAFSDRAEAFCILNDQSIAANYLIDRNLCKKILILDLDVHQGNGTAEIFRNKTNVFTASFHGENNYPFRKEKSDFDYGFQNNVSDIEYLNVIKYEVPRLIENFEPNFIFYLSGVDIIEDDKLGKLSVSLLGCKERDRFVLDYCMHNKIPIQVSMGGGYSTDINTIVEAHANTYRLAQEIFF